MNTLKKLIEQRLPHTPTQVKIKVGKMIQEIIIPFVNGIYRAS